MRGFSNEISPGENFSSDFEVIFGDQTIEFAIFLGGRRKFIIISGDHFMNRRRWSGREIQMLGERYADEGPRQLALEMGRSQDSVSSFAHRCGLRTRRWLKRKEADSSQPGPVAADCGAGRCLRH